MPDRYRVILCPQAAEDLQHIAARTRQRFPQEAPDLATLLLNAIDSLQHAPERFRSVGHSRRCGTMIRALVMAPFIVHYKIDAKARAVPILSIMHAPRQLAQGHL